MMAALKRIRLSPDYRAAMAKVKRLWGPEFGMPEGDRPDMLPVLIDAHEHRRDLLASADLVEASDLCSDAP